MPAPRRLFVQVDERYGRGVVIDPEIRIPGGSRDRRGATLLCDCGNLYSTALSQLKSGKTQSCGCIAREWSAQVHQFSDSRTHELSKHELYNTWTHVISRCEDPGHHAYHRYGGRGITLHEPWHDVAIFIREVEAEIGKRPAGLTLDRVNNDQGYKPGNIRWASWKEQHNNTEKILTFRARMAEVYLLLHEGLSYQQIADKLDINKEQVRSAARKLLSEEFLC